uniref:NADH:ubiquinone reductase (H(+)-translocating) n=1 Tax=Capsaloides cristatus TaxID=1101449 RepID=A0A6M3R5M5_9PLAT|nr:NADH dehydrogenase subunit 5 [Capsaloides cristatus]
MISVVLIILILLLSLGSVSLNFYINLSSYSNFILDYCLDTGSNYCLLMLFICSLVSLLFSFHYFSWEHNNLNIIIIFFVSVMAYLVMTHNLFNSLIGWEYLGFVSFLLILYYGTYDSVRASNITLVSSRFGDVGLFLLIGLLFNYFSSPWFLYVLLFSFILFTKSACIPFTSWLLEAMRAPTPVSCLVHSSTLVAAGIWFVVSYGHYLSSWDVPYLLVPCFFTILASSFSSLYFLDVKKLVALSTCNNISWCVVYYCMGFTDLCLIQLLSHGVAKCMLFCMVGDILSSSNSNQINSGLYSPLNQNSFSSYCLCLLVLFVSGLPFQGVFFSKHILLGLNSFGFNVGYLFILYLCVFMTYVYSFRLYMLVSNIFSGQSSGLQNTFYFLGGLFVLGCLFNFFFSFNIIESYSLSIVFSLLILFIQILGCFIGWLLNINAGSFFSSSVYGQDFLLSFSSAFFNFVSSGLYYVGSFRSERYLSGFLQNLNLFSLNLGGLIQLNIFFISAFVLACFFFF